MAGMCLERLARTVPSTMRPTGRFTWLSSVSLEAALDILAKKNSGEQRHVLSQNLAEDEVSWSHSDLFFRRITDARSYGTYAPSIFMIFHTFCPAQIDATNSYIARAAGDRCFEDARFRSCYGIIQRCWGVLAGLVSLFSIRSLGMDSFFAEKLCWGQLPRR